MNSALMFSKATDEWATPQDTFDALDAEFDFMLDAAATAENAKAPAYITQAEDALAVSWLARIYGNVGGSRAVGLMPAVWLNPPYSKCREFIARAAEEARRGCTVVCLVPSRTDTRWWAESVMPYASEIRFVKGRLKFGGSLNSAPFPSAVVVFRPPFEGSQLVVSSFSLGKDGRRCYLASRPSVRK